jgi:hypothetical protein
MAGIEDEDAVELEDAGLAGVETLVLDAGDEGGLTEAGEQGLDPVGS